MENYMNKLKAIILCVVLSFGVFGMTACGDSGVTLSMFRQFELGMTKQQVLSIMGTEPRHINNVVQGDILMELWTFRAGVVNRNGTRTITVSFANNDIGETWGILDNTLFSASYSVASPNESSETMHTLLPDMDLLPEPEIE
jgi:hypothetical protein